MSRDLTVFGCGGHARSVLDVFFTVRPNASVLLIDPDAKPNERVLGCPVMAYLDSLQAPFFFALGSPYARQELLNAYGEHELISILSPRAYVGCCTTLAKGVFIGHGAHVGPEAFIGKCAIINTGAIIEHEVIMGDFSHAAPRSTIAGRCKIGARTMIGAGAIVRDSIEVGSDIIVGAGSLVVSHLKEPGVYVGSPARKIK